MRVVIVNKYLRSNLLRDVVFVACCWLCAASAVLAQQANQTTNAPASAEKNSAYLLGPDDEITVRAFDVDEIDGKTARIDRSGNVGLPLVGNIKAGGLNVSQFASELTKDLSKYVREPRVSITVSEYKSQPVSVLGALNTPGIYNLTGPTTLEQVLSRAGGLRNDAGNTINITRQSAWGPIPLASAKLDPSGSFSTVSISVKSLMDASDPRNNILVEPTDVISVPRADLVYVVGSVNKPGGFVLNERASMSVLQAVSLAEGLQKTSSPKSAKIVRTGLTGSKEEIPVNLSKILSGSAPDIPLLANDILFVPNSAAKSATYRILEAAIQTGTGVAIFHP
jgi:polysaccharide export outer membrane protein